MSTQCREWGGGGDTVPRGHFALKFPRDSSELLCIRPQSMGRSLRSAVTQLKHMAEQDTKNCMIVPPCSRLRAVAGNRDMAVFRAQEPRQQHLQQQQDPRRTSRWPVSAASVFPEGLQQSDR